MALVKDFLTNYVIFLCHIIVRWLTIYMSVFMRVISIEYEAEISYAEQFQKRLSREKF